MYWKKDKTDTIGVGSIRTRLTLFYTLGVAILLTLFALFLYWMAINILYKADYQFLADEINMIKYKLSDKSLKVTDLKHAIISIPLQSESSIYHYYIRLSDRKKNVFIETPGMKNILPVNKKLYSHAELAAGKKYFWYYANNKQYLIIQSKINLSSLNQVSMIQIALDISHQHSIINDRKKILFCLLLGTVSALLIGLLVANRGIKSLDMLIKTVQTLTYTSLHQRIDPKTWPKELRSLGFAFNQMLDRMESSFLKLKQFSADLSHELRTPITNLMGETEVTLSYAQSIDEYRKVMESNLEELQRISSLIENILFLARAENSHIAIEKNVLNVHHEIKIVCEYYEAIADEKKIQVSLEGAACLRANPIMFRRMISNILSNAINYTQQNGRIHFHLNQNDQKVEITLVDNGIGIEEAHLSKIFDRFYRVEEARSHQLGGSGLGLAIVKSIVELHQGRITVSSELNKGTLLIITLPK